MTIGTVHNKDALFMTFAVGEAKSDDNTFELNTSMSGSPIVRCVETGKWFSLGWSEILQLADEAGITEEDKPA